MQTKYPSTLAGYYGYGMSNYIPQVGDTKFPYFNFSQTTADSLHSAIGGYNCKFFFFFFYFKFFKIYFIFKKQIRNENKDASEQHLQERN